MTGPGLPAIDLANDHDRDYLDRVSATMQRIAADVAVGTPPDETYTPDMRVAYASMAADLAKARERNPNVEMWIPSDVDGC